MTSFVTKARRRIAKVVRPDSHYYPNWNKLLAKDRDHWQASVEASKGGPKILIATSVGGHVPLATLDSLLAVALTLRGAEVHILLCNRYLTACEFITYHTVSNVETVAMEGVPRRICRDCYGGAYAMYHRLGLPIHKYSDLITSEEIINATKTSQAIIVDEIRDYQLEELHVGEHAVAGALRFFARGDLTAEPYAEQILRHYLKSAIMTTYVARRIFEKHLFECASFHHGIYVPQGLVGEVARKQGIRIANWSPAYRKKSYIFSHSGTYHHTLMSEPSSTWENLEWTPQMEKEIEDYLKSRWQGTRDWIWFHDTPQEDIDEIKREVGLDFSRPCIGLLTNVMWDAQLHYPANAFKDMREWVIQSIKYFAGRPELQLVIRVHPAELRGTVESRQLMVDEIKKAFPQLPSNIFIIPPESQVSTYVIMAQCNAVIIYGTKTGVELTSMGIPVIVAGEAWIRNKGLTYDAHSVDEYLSLLDMLPLPSRLDAETVKRARKYAYHFFFRRMIPVNCIEPKKGRWPYRIKFSGLEEILPRRDPGLDVICDGILRGKPFVFPAEIYGSNGDKFDSAQNIEIDTNQKCF